MAHSGHRSPFVEATIRAAAGLLLLVAPAAHGEEQLLAVVVNGLGTGATLLVDEVGGRLAAPVHDLAGLHIRTDGMDHVERQGQTFAVISGAPGVVARVDRAGQRLLLDLADGARTRQAVEAGVPAPIPSPRLLSGFMDYDVTMQASRNEPEAGVLLNAGVSASPGVLETAAIARNGRQAVRLDTSFIHDEPDGPTRFVVGDAIVRPSAWGRPARFGGFLIGREAGLQPNVLRYAGPMLLGQTDLPATVDVFINNVLRYQTQVQPGPFALEGVPYVTGAGEARVIVHDALGRETAVTTPFQVSPRVLSEGLGDFAFQAGALRDAYGQHSFSYGAPFAAGFYRRGLGYGLTVEGAAEIRRSSKTVGGAVAAALPYLGTFEIAEAISRSGHGTAALSRASYLFQQGAVSVAVNAERGHRDFAQIGRMDANPVVQRLSTTAAVSLGEHWGTLSATVASLRHADETSSSVASVSHGWPLWKGSYLMVTGMSDLHRRDTTVAAFLTVPLGSDRTLVIDGRRTAAGVTGAASGQQRPAGEWGWGFDARTEAGANPREQAGVTWDGQQASARLEVEHGSAGTAARVNAAGSVVAVAGNLFASRKNGTSQALVRIPGYRGLTVYSQNRPAATLDDDGMALIPNLLPYQDNRISIDVEELPLTARLDTDATMVVPAYRSTAEAAFTVGEGGGAFVQAVRADGQVLPAGTRLRVDGGAATIITGEDGRVFIPAARTGMRLVAILPKGQDCAFTLPEVGGGEALPHLGQCHCEP